MQPTNPHELRNKNREVKSRRTAHTYNYVKGNTRFILVESS